MYNHGYWLASSSCMQEKTCQTLIYALQRSKAITVDQAEEARTGLKNGFKHASINAMKETNPCTAEDVKQMF